MNDGPYTCYKTKVFLTFITFPHSTVGRRQTRRLWQHGRKFCPDVYTHTKDHLDYFSEKKNGWWYGGVDRLPEILG